VQVLQDGRIGETVRVQAPAATGPVLARVLSDGLLEMTQ
jgi:flagella basal body P-ring formation protein FlgA